MKSLRRALLLALMLLLPMVTAAAPPEPRSWSPYAAAGHFLNAIALADDANVTALAWASPGPRTEPGTLPDANQAPPVTERYDVSALSTDDGILWNSTPPNTVPPVPPGKDMVAISRDGGVIMAARSAQPESTQPNVVVFDTDATLTPGQQNPTPGSAPAPATMSAAWSKRLQGGVQAIAVAADGRTSAVAEADETGTDANPGPTILTLRVYNDAGAERIAVTPPGNVTSLVFSEDGSRLVVGGDRPGPEGLGGSLQIIGVGVAGRSEGSLASPVTALDASGDVSVLLAGTEDGHAVVWRPAGTAVGQPERDLDLGLGAVRNVAVARAGTTAVVGTTTGFAVVRFDADLPRVAYNVSTPDPVSAVDVSDDGSYFLVVAKDAFGYAISSKEKLWNLTGPFLGGAMDGSAQALVLQRSDGVGSYRFGRSLQFLHETAAGRVADVPAATTGPDGTVAFDTVVLATGANDRVRVRLPQAPGVSFTSNVTEASIAAGGALHVRITARPTDLAPGAYAFLATAESTQGGGTANLSLPLSVLPRSGVALALTGPTERVLARGGSDEAVFVLQNGGNTRINATLSFTQTVSAGASWPIELQTTRTAVPAGATTSIVLRVSHPASAANGTVDRITLTAATDAGTVTKVVTYTLSPTLGITLDTPSRVRFVGPAQSTWFNLTVKNTGSVRAPYEIFYEKLGETGAGWNVEVDVLPFNLTAAGTAGATRVVPLRVFAPNTGTSTDRVTLFVEARSLDKIGRKHIAAENLTLIANLDPSLAAKPPGVVPCDGARCLPSVPAVGVVLVLALAAAAVAATSATTGRRRR